MSLRELRGRMARLQDRLPPSGDRPTGVVRINLETGEPFPEDLRRNPRGGGLGVMVVPVPGTGTVEAWEAADFGSPLIKRPAAR